MSYIKTEDGVITQDQFNKIEGKGRYKNRGYKNLAWNAYNRLEKLKEDAQKANLPLDLTKNEDYQLVISNCDEVIKMCAKAAEKKKGEFGVNTYRMNYYIEMVSLKGDLFCLTEEHSKATEHYKLLLKYPLGLVDFQGEYALITYNWNISEIYYQWSTLKKAGEDMHGQVVYFQQSLDYLVETIMAYRLLIPKSRGDLNKELRETAVLFINRLKEFAELINDAQLNGESQLTILDLKNKAQKSNWHRLVSNDLSSDQLKGCYSNHARIASGEYQDRLVIAGVSDQAEAKESVKKRQKVTRKNNPRSSRAMDASDSGSQSFEGDSDFGNYKDVMDARSPLRGSLSGVKFDKTGKEQYSESLPPKARYSSHESVGHAELDSVPAVPVPTRSSDLQEGLSQSDLFQAAVAFEQATNTANERKKKPGKRPVAPKNSDVESDRFTENKKAKAIPDQEEELLMAHELFPQLAATTVVAQNPLSFFNAHYLDQIEPGESMGSNPFFKQSSSPKHHK